MKRTRLWLPLFCLGLAFPATGQEVTLLPLGDAIVPIVEASAELIAYPHLTSPSVELSEIDFGEVVVGNTYSSLAFVIDNVGGLPTDGGRIVFPGLDPVTGCAGDLCFGRLLDGIWQDLVTYQLEPGEFLIGRVLWTPQDSGSFSETLTFEGGASPLSLVLRGTAVPSNQAVIQLIDAEDPSQPMLTDILFDDANRAGTETLSRRFLLRNLGEVEISGGELLGLEPGTACLPDGFRNKCFYTIEGGSITSYSLGPEEEKEVVVYWYHSPDEVNVDRTDIVSFTNGTGQSAKSNGQSASLDLHTKVLAADPPGGPTGPGGIVGYPDEFGGVRGLFNQNLFFSDLDVDSINKMNGNLVVSIPLGQAWEVGPSFSYGLTLVHNSNKWQVRSLEDIGITDPLFADDYFTVPFPSNAGLGWNVSLGGELYVSSAYFGGFISDWPNRMGDHTWVYVDPSGGTHGIGGAGGNDDSLIRLRGVPQDDVIYVDLPSGIVQQFRRYGEGCPALHHATGQPFCWRIERIEDPFGNHVGIDYDSSLLTTITDSHGRQLKVRYQTFTPHPDDFQPSSVRKVITGIDFPATGSGDAVWDFSHSEPRITRACPVEQGAFSWDERQLRVPILDALVLPPQANAGRYVFTHNTTVEPPGNRWCVDDGGALLEIESPSKGRLRYQYANVRLPIGCPTANHQDPPDYAESRGVRRRWVEPADREAREKSMQTFSFGRADRLYEPAPPYHCTRDNTIETHVVHSPAQHYEEQDHFRHEVFFHTATKSQYHNPTNGDWRHRDYGLPISKNEDLAVTSAHGGGEKLFLSSVVLDCETDNTLVDFTNPQDCEVHRKTYRSYAYKTFPENCPDRLFIGCSILARPLRAVREHHGAEFKETRFSEYDGYGNFRLASTKSDLGGPTLTTTERTNHFVWVDSVRTYPVVGIDASMTLGDLPRDAEPWILGLFDSKESKPDGGIRRADFTFDEQGFLGCRRTYADIGTPTNPPEIGDRDLTVTYTDADADGRPDWEEYAGGDRGGAGCGAMPEYRLFHTYDMGQLETSVFRDASGADAGPLLVDNTYDPATGRVSRTCDHSIHPVLCAGLTYDHVGRVTLQAPSPSRGIRRTFGYALLGEGGGRATVTTEDASDGDRLVGQSKLTFDEFGREVLVESRISEERSDPRRSDPGVADWIEQRKGYHGDDRLQFVTGVFDADLWAGMDGGDDGDGENWKLRTRYKFRSYDIHGRLIDFLNPKGEWVGFEYFGGASNWVQRAEYFGDGSTHSRRKIDHLGRTVKVFEGLLQGQNPEDAYRQTSYSYSSGLETAARSSAAPAATQQRQRRLDGRGLVVWERIPEKTSGIDYRYDARGNVIQIDDNGWKVKSVYDAAGRLRSRETANGRLLEARTYLSNAQGGRLETATRYNYFAGSTTGGYAEVFLGPGEETLVVEVLDTYSYNNLGQVETKEMQLDWVKQDSNGGETGRTVQARMLATWLYDGLGRVREAHHPPCESGGLCGFINDAGFEPLAIRNTWSMGELVRTELSDGPVSWTGLFDYEYHPSGGLRGLERFGLDGQSVGYDERTEFVYQTRDGTLEFPDLTLPRTGAIHSRLSPGGTTLWQSGDYSYDGRGQINRIGGTSYAYDEVKRLTRMNGEEHYTYDVFDNLLTGTDLLAFEVSPSSNRLTTAAGGPVFYDGRGDLVDTGAVHARYDELGKQLSWWWNMPAPSPYDYQSLYVYSADGDRVAIVNRLPTGDPSPPPGAQGGVHDPDGGLGGDFSELLMTFHAPGGTPLREFRITDEAGAAPSRIYAPGVRSYVGRDAVVFQGSDGVEDHPLTLRHLTSDHIGSVRSARDFGATGEITSRRNADHFSPYGVKQDTPATWIHESLGFAGHMSDRNGGNYELPRDGNGFTTFMKARSYAQEVGRFLSVDPARDSAAWSLYAYAGNDPINMVDPTGQSAEDDEKAKQVAETAKLVLATGVAAAAVADEVQVLSGVAEVATAARKAHLATTSEVVANTTARIESGTVVASEATAVNEASANAIRRAGRGAARAGALAARAGRVARAVTFAGLALLVLEIAVDGGTEALIDRIDTATQDLVENGAPGEQEATARFRFRQAQARATARPAAE